MGVASLILLFLFSQKGSPFGAPVAPGGSAVTQLVTGRKYKFTLLFRGLGTAQPTPTPDVLAASANVALTPASAFTVDPTQTHVVQNADGTWSAQVTATFTGGAAGASYQLGNQAWILLQMQAA